jgi:protein SCO1/2
MDVKMTRRCFFVLPLVVGPLTAQKNQPAAQEIQPSPAEHYFTDVVLVNQFGQPMRFYTDLLKDRVVVVNAFFSACKDSCPMMAGTYSKLQDVLGTHLGKDAYLISISVDSESDTPEKLKAYGERFHARPGWFFLTGKKENVEFALNKVGLKPPRKEDHLTVFMIGNLATGLWKKALGLASAEEISKIVQKVLRNED